MVKAAKDKKVDIKAIFLGLQEEMAAKLRSTRKNVKHPTAKGNVSENSWKSLLEKYLPRRYAVESAFIIDSNGAISDQIDLVIFDRHFSPCLLHQDGACYIPAESVYAIFEIKQDITTRQMRYAAKKAASVRKLKRTSATIAHAGGKYDPVVPKPIIAGFLALTTAGTTRKLSPQLQKAFSRFSGDQTLNLACVLERGALEVVRDASGKSSLKVFKAKNALINFFLALLSKLQAVGSAPAMDIDGYRIALQL